MFVDSESQKSGKTVSGQSSSHLEKKKIALRLKYVHSCFNWQLAFRRQ